MIIPERDELLTEFAKVTLKERYLIDGETSPQQAFARAAKAFADNPAHAERLYDYISKQWLSLATPVLSNAPQRKSWSDTWEDNFNGDCFVRRSRGLPISCFLNHVPDSREGISAHYDENIWLSSTGGGIGSNWGALRSDGTATASGSASTGVIPFISVMDRQVLAFSQGTTRRGSYAAYLDIGHPEVKEFISMRKPSGGDLNRKGLNIHHGINITDTFMRRVEAGKPWHLIDPHSEEVVHTVDARELWQSILETRVATGEPYLHFITTSNSKLPQHLKDQNLRINNSNLCTEIMLPTSEDRTAVCCLSSLNALYYSEWREDDLFIEDVVRMLDNVLEYFIVHSGRYLKRAAYSAAQERSIGIGLLGYHSYLQSKGIPLDSGLSISHTRAIQKHIKEKAYEASEHLGEERGLPPAGGTRRNSHLIAIAPNASSSIILGCSPSIEPWKANAYIHKTSSGSWTVKNPQLEAALEEEGLNTNDIWKKIIQAEGSVAGIDAIPEHIRECFKTSFEYDQRWIIEHNAHRQEFVDQGISVNIFLPADVSVRELHGIHYMAWERGLKSLYYLRSESVRRAENVTQTIERQEVSYDECIACEG